MNIYYFNDEDFRKTSVYEDFINEYPATGNLRVRAYTANSAVPIQDLDVVISKEYDNSIIIFYEGKTDESGLIENIILPAPELNSNIMTDPNSITYEINVSSSNNNIKRTYKVNIYENVSVVQNMNIVPSGDYYGS